VSLGRSGLSITCVGLGAWALGGSNAPHSWSLQSDADSIQVIERALERGINWIDTAAIYGLGHSEELIGSVTVGLPSAHRPYVFTKCAAHATAGGEIYFDLRREAILRELEQSLQRLQTDCIDLYQIHRPLPAAEVEEGWRTLAELKAEGLVDHIGVSNFSVEELRRIETIAPVETIQPPYSLLRRDAEASLFPYAQDMAIGVLTYSPLASGLLSGTMTRERLQALPETDWRRQDARFAEPTLSHGLVFAERLRAVGSELGVQPGAVAIAWALRHPAVHAVIVGFRNAAQVDELGDASTLALPAEAVSLLEAPLSDRAQS
jgi:aryl-alcohol dehydrogenase-like predicted oxidoreductase